jgi:hypothetical protein
VGALLWAAEERLENQELSVSRERGITLAFRRASIGEAHTFRINPAQRRAVMRKFVISFAAAGAALLVASPAAAQYYPQQQYGYGQQPYGYGAQGYGFNNGYGQVRALQQRIDALQHRIRYMGVRGKSAQRLRDESRSIERRLRSAQYNGLNPYEANDIQRRIARLEQRVKYAMAGRNGRYGYSSYGKGYNNAYNGAYYGRGDRDDDHDYDRGHDRDDDHDYDRDDD